jgi:hypothetical protein
VLHPYYKLAYIKLAWGGPVEQAAEIAVGNVDAKDWQDEARKIVERTVSIVFLYTGYKMIQLTIRWRIIMQTGPPKLLRVYLPQKTPLSYPQTPPF